MNEKITEFICIRPCKITLKGLGGEELNCFDIFEGYLYCRGENNMQIKVTSLPAGYFDIGVNRGKPFYGSVALSNAVYLLDYLANYCGDDSQFKLIKKIAGYRDDNESAIKQIAEAGIDFNHELKNRMVAEIKKQTRGIYV